MSFRREDREICPGQRVSRICLLVLLVLGPFGARSWLRRIEILGQVCGTAGSDCRRCPGNLDGTGIPVVRTVDVDVLDMVIGVISVEKSVGLKERRWTMSERTNAGLASLSVSTVGSYAWLLEEHNPAPQR